LRSNTTCCPEIQVVSNLVIDIDKFLFTSLRQNQLNENFELHVIYLGTGIFKGVAIGVALLTDTKSTGCGSSSLGEDFVTIGGPVID